MKKLKFGHDKRNLNHKQVDNSLIKLSRREIIDVEKQVEMIMVKHAATFQKLAEYEAKEVSATVAAPVVTLEKIVVSKYDKWARKHSKLSAKKTEKMMDEVLEAMNAQNEAIHMAKNANGMVVTEMEKLHKQMLTMKADLTRVTEQKPVEKHIVTEKTNPHSKIVVAGVVLSLILNIVAIILAVK